MRALKEGRFEEFEGLKKQIIAEQETDEEKCRAESLWTASAYAVAGADVIKDLVKLSVKYPKFHYPLEHLGYVYESEKDYRRAVELLERVAQIADAPDTKFQLQLRAAQAMRRGGRLDDAELKLQELGKGSLSDFDLAEVFEEWGEIWSQREDQNQARQSFEKSLTHNPDNLSLRFRLAYSYSHAETHEKALYHYDILYSRKPDYSHVANNLAIALEKLDMPIRCVALLKKAASLGQSLPMANLADRLLDAGFADEAEEWIRKAEACSDVHARVGHVLREIKTRQKEESEREEVILKSVLSSYQSST